MKNLLILLMIFSWPVFSATNVSIQKNQLFVDDEAIPQLYGAEIQYFRLRGGSGKNIPREKVLEIWNRALDQAVKAGMNSVSFYIPWDFHEYKEGYFDFTGTADEDGDGKADYPSRDVITFIKLVQQHGINKIMVRPGPYINAEWGFLGFGAIPLWFHEKYPDSHMYNSSGLKTKLYDYHSPELLAKTKVWFEAVYNQVLKPYIGKKGSPILFLQIDNETNFMWQSIYNHDYGPRAVSRYRTFLKEKFLTLDDLNQKHQRQWKSWNEIRPPVKSGVSISEDQSWYEFQDYSIFTYLKKIRKMWEEIGVKEPQVLFTLAESYNGMKDGILPNFHYRNKAHETGMMTLNMYPKTYEPENMPFSPLLNLPFKIDHDVLAMDAANDSYLGHAEEWLLGPELQGGWWKGIPVSVESRRQTYLSGIGNGLKAMYVYYFTEGDNWQASWAKDQVRPFYKKLKNSRKWRRFDEEELPKSFWRKLQGIIDHKVIVGIDAYRVMRDKEATSPTLYFDAPLDKEAFPKANGAFADIVKIGKKVVGPYQNFLGKAVRLKDPVFIIKDDRAHSPSTISGIDSVQLNSQWSGGLLGLIKQTGASPQIHHWNLNDQTELKKAKLIFYQDTGIFDLKMANFFQNFIEEGGMVVSYLGGTLAKNLNINFASKNGNSNEIHKVYFQDSQKGNIYFDAAKTPFFTYSHLDERCSPILWSQEQGIQDNVAGFKCDLGKGSFVQIGSISYDIYNSDWYGVIADGKERTSFIKTLFDLANLQPQIQIDGDDQVTLSARKLPDGESLWITLKNGRPVTSKIKLHLGQNLQNKICRGLPVMKRLMTGEEHHIDNQNSIEIELLPYDSDVFFFGGLCQASY